MAKALYIVIQSMGKWWVDFEGRAQGPHASREAAALDARSHAQFSASIEKPARVLVPDNQGKYWIIWDSQDATNSVPKRVSQAA